MTIKGGISQACAACKYQRRKCAEDCPLAQYFPADQPKSFQNVHRLFGVCNIMKILRQVPPAQHEEAMRSVKYESDMRARFPVMGCLGIIRQLQFQLQQVSQEFHYMQTQLAICKDRGQQYQQNPLEHPAEYSPSSQLQLGIATANTALPVYQHNLMPNHDFPINEINGPFEVGDNLEKEQFAVQQYNHNDMNHINAMTVQSNLVGPEGFPLQQEMKVSHYDIPFDTFVDDRHSLACESRYTDESDFMNLFSKSIDALNLRGCTFYLYENKLIHTTSKSLMNVMCSVESSFKETKHSVKHACSENELKSAENELKSADACFSLTNVK